MAQARGSKKKAAAPKKAAARAETAPAPTVTLMPLRPLFEVSEDTPQYYVNYMEVTLSLHEFALTFGRLPSRLNLKQWENIANNRPIVIPCDLQVVIPLH